MINRPNQLVLLILLLLKANKQGEAEALLLDLSNYPETAIDTPTITAVWAALEGNKLHV